MIFLELPHPFLSPQGKKDGVGKGADRENPLSQGYPCRKGAKIAYFQNNPERLKFPLKRVGDRFERISWVQALDETLARLRKSAKPMIPGMSPTWGVEARVAILKRASACGFYKGWGQRIIIAPWARNLLGFIGWEGKPLTAKVLFSEMNKQLISIY
jgi:anaerobic selenocysteine-containing dehydrogenase